MLECILLAAERITVKQPGGVHLSINAEASPDKMNMEDFVVARRGFYL
jgi:hypothetical protein